MNDLMTETMAITTVVKILVDMTQLGMPTMPKWFKPLSAVIYGIVVGQLFLLSNGDEVTRQAIATSILSGVLSAGAAIGVTELQKRVQ